MNGVEMKETEEDLQEVDLEADTEKKSFMEEVTETTLERETAPETDQAETGQAAEEDQVRDHQSPSKTIRSPPSHC